MTAPIIQVQITDNRLPTLMAQAPAKANQLLRILANEGRNKAVMLIHESPASGRTYQRGRRTHTASSPGNPPRTDTGALINSINVEQRGAFSQSINAGTDYAAYLEFGTSTMEARPFMGPMALWLEEQVPIIFDGFIK